MQGLPAVRPRAARYGAGRRRGRRPAGRARLLLRQAPERDAAVVEEKDVAAGLLGARRAVLPVQHVRVAVHQEARPALLQLALQQLAVQRLGQAVDRDAAPRARRLRLDVLRPRPAGRPARRPIDRGALRAARRSPAAAAPGLRGLGARGAAPGGGRRGAGRARASNRVGGASVLADSARSSCSVGSASSSGSEMNFSFDRVPGAGCGSAHTRASGPPHVCVAPGGAARATGAAAAE